MALVDPLVALAVEVLGAQEVGHLDDGVGVDQQRAKDGAFRLDAGGDGFGGNFHCIHRRRLHATNRKVDAAGRAWTGVSGGCRS
jgi:hypothetical protein